MKPKSAIGVLLLLFALGSIVYMAVGELRSKTAPSAGVPDIALGVVEGVEPDVIVYFFDSDKECTTCEKLEAYAFEAITSQFADELAAGELQWQLINTDEPQNEHYLMEYGLYTKSVVLVDMEAGRQNRWENLEQLWELVYDKPAYLEYIGEHTRAYLETPS